MSRIVTIARREFLTRLRSLAFVLGTLLTPLAAFCWLALPGYLATQAAGRQDVLVLDQSGDPELYPTLVTVLARESATGPGGAPLAELFSLQREALGPGDDLAALRRARAAERHEGDGRALLVLPTGVLADADPEYFGATPGDPTIADFARALGVAVQQRRLARAGVDPDLLDRLGRAPQLKLLRAAAAGALADEDAESVALVMLSTMYVVTFLYGVWVMRGVAHEKRTRIAELLLTAARPVELMAGKLLGIGLLGLFQCGLWVLGAALLGTRAGVLGGLQLPRIPAPLLGYFLVYFVLGYFLYATLYALAGAASSGSDDAPQVQMPVTMLTLAPLLVFFTVLREPSGTVAVLLSLVPFFAPTLMLLRLAVSNPPAWQVVTSLALMLAAGLVAVWATAKVYRAGILMSGKRITLPELWRWLRYA
jgi:ABC-2 type transport system permease protein